MAPPLSLEKFEVRLAALEAQAKRGGTTDPRIPLLATEFDVETAIFPPLVRAFSGTNQTLTTGVAAALAFASESLDTDSMHDTTTNNTRLTFNTPGVYYLEAQAEFAADANNRRYLALKLNGTTTFSDSNHSAASAAAHRELCGALYPFELLDYVEAIALQDSGGDLIVNPARLYAFWVAPTP